MIHYSPIFSVGSGGWQIGKIVNYSAQQLTREEIDRACIRLNSQPEPVVKQTITIKLSSEDLQAIVDKAVVELRRTL